MADNSRKDVPTFIRTAAEINHILFFAELQTRLQTSDCLEIETRGASSLLSRRVFRETFCLWKTPREPSRCFRTPTPLTAAERSWQTCDV